MDIYARGSLQKISQSIYLAAEALMEDMDTGNYPFPSHTASGSMGTVCENARNMPKLFEESDQVSLPFPGAPAFARVKERGEKARVVVSFTRDPEGYFSKFFTQTFEEDGIEVEMGETGVKTG